jgi:hypothetical protein
LRPADQELAPVSVMRLNMIDDGRRRHVAAEQASGKADCFGVADADAVSSALTVPCPPWFLMPRADFVTDASLSS